MEFTVTHNEEGLKTLYHEWWKAVHGVRNAWAGGMLIFCLMVMLALQSMSWMLVLPTLGSAAFFGLVQMIRYQSAKTAIQAFVNAGRPVLNYRFDDQGLTETSTMGEVNIPWARFAGLTKVGRFWLLFRGPLQDAQFIVFPDHCIPQEALDYIKQRFAGKR